MVGGRSGRKQRKRRMAEQALWPMGDTIDDLSGLQASIDTAAVVNGTDALAGTMTALFARDGLSEQIRHSDGTYEIR